MGSIKVGIMSNYTHLRGRNDHPLALGIIASMLGIFLYIGLRGSYTVSRVSDAYVYTTSPVAAQFRYQDLPMAECAWCRAKVNLNRHHVIPQHTNPGKRDDVSNLVVLCRSCHYCLGHRNNWHKYNPDVLELVTIYTNCVDNVPVGDAPN